MRRRRRLHVWSAAPLVLCAASWGGAARAERYEVAATSVLALDREGGLVQSWSVDCTADNPVTDAAVTLSGKDLRFFLADEEPLEVGVDGVTYGLGESTGQYRYRAVPGSRVIARLDVRCGGPDVFDSIVVDSAPVIVPPALLGPESVVDIETLAEVDGDALIVGRAVELGGMRVEASPRGTEVVTVTVVGGGLDEELTLVADDFTDGAAVIAPLFTPTVSGEIIVTATLLEASSSSVRLVAVTDSGLPDEDDDQRSAVGSGCVAGGLPGGFVPGGLVLLGLAAGRRRRRSSTTAPR